MNNNTYQFKKVDTQSEAEEILNSLSEVRGAWEKSLSFNEMKRIFRQCDKILTKYQKPLQTRSI